MLRRIACMLALGALLASSAFAQTDSGPAYGPLLEGFDYPFAVQHYKFTSQGMAMDMAYMDVPSDHANGQTVVLLHGKNFCAATWEHTIAVLRDAGYRVIAPDQVGFCKSTKPAHYQFSFEQLAANTHALLAQAGVTKAVIMGHSTGGMLAIRYALMYPADTQQLVLVDPVGLEDWRAKGTPWPSLETLYAAQQATTADSIRDYEKSTYYAGSWKPQYERWVQMLAGMYRGPGRDAVAWDSALLYDMIYTQPVVHELGGLTMPVLLMVGDKDTTAIDKQYAPAALRPQLGNYPVLAKQAAGSMPHARLVDFPDLGHTPQLMDPDAFHTALLNGLARP